MATSPTTSAPWAAGWRRSALTATIRAQGYPSQKCVNWPAKRSADVRAYDPDVSILLAGRWEVLDRFYEGQWMHVGDPAYDNYLLRQLNLAIQVLSSNGAKVLLLTTPCFAPAGAARRLDVAVRRSRPRQPVQPAAAPGRGAASGGRQRRRSARSDLPDRHVFADGQRGRRAQLRRHPHLRRGRSVRR